eukprot:TRINITY_DN11814_c0_g1_i1.p1 TRINITY_DN11814_c0_g1~~TRINITY_DN11814_c0_g1_i1.p1  ORF type:complete len:193 (-),score=18.26 TRINITY_DN11814_c0_g1_i1:421-999(-)
MGWHTSVLKPQIPPSKLLSQRSLEKEILSTDNSQSCGPSLDCEVAPSELLLRRASGARESKSKRALLIKHASSPARIFVRAPGCGAVPVDLDLSWAVVSAKAHIVSVCSLGDISRNNSNELYVLKFRGKVLPLKQSLRECRVELGSVLCLEYDDFGHEGPLPASNGFHEAGIDVGRMSRGPRLGTRSLTISL